MTANPVNVAASTDRRQFPRWSTAGLESALGRITDLSLSGMRIRKTGNPGLREGDRFRLEVRHEETVFLLPAQLASVRPHAADGAGGMVDLGIRFPEMTKAQKRMVKKILEAAGWPDGGGEILFKALPDEEDDAAAAPPLAVTAPPVATAAPAAPVAVPEPVPVPVAALPQPASAPTATPSPPEPSTPAANEPPAPVPEFAFSPLPLSGMEEGEAEPVAEDRPLPSLASWSQLTEAADGPATTAAAAPPATPKAEPVPASPPPPPPPSPLPQGGGLSTEEAEEIAALGATASGIAEIAERAAAPPEASAPRSHPTGPANDFQAKPGNSGLRHLPTSGPEGSAPRQQNQRKNGRLAAQDAHTALGEVMDISASGMRIRRRGTKPVEVGSHFLLDLYVCGRAVRLPVEVVRIMKSGWRSYDYGLRFGELPPEMRAQFGMLARMAAKHVSIA